jgi:integrase
MKKIQQDGAWRFVSLGRSGKRYIWDPRPGTYYLEWWDGGQRRREAAGETPSQVIGAQRRKQLELSGGPYREAGPRPQAPERPNTSTTLAAAKEIFLAHIRAHSPDKPETERRYRQVLDHFERLMAHCAYVEAITRADIDDYKIARQQEQSLRHSRLITPSTINFEVGTLRTFFYYLIKERGVKTENPCARFKQVRDAKHKARRRPPSYQQTDLDALFAHTDAFEKAVFATLLLTGLRKRELYFLCWRDVDLSAANLRVSGEDKVGFSPKDYEERTIPVPPDLVDLLSGLPRRAEWVFPNRNWKPNQTPAPAPAEHCRARRGRRSDLAQIPAHVRHAVARIRRRYRNRPEAHGTQRHRDNAPVPQPGRRPEAGGRQPAFVVPSPGKWRPR